MKLHTSFFNLNLILMEEDFDNLQLTGKWRVDDDGGKKIVLFQVSFDVYELKGVFGQKKVFSRTQTTWLDDSQITWYTKGEEQRCS